MTIHWHDETDQRIAGLSIPLLLLLEKYDQSSSESGKQDARANKESHNQFTRLRKI
jgi:hypothetical protein